MKCIARTINTYEHVLCSAKDGYACDRMYTGRTQASFRRLEDEDGDDQEN
jgi:capsular polysaccharide biosynthesis protein